MKANKGARKSANEKQTEARVEKEYLDWRREGGFRRVGQGMEVSGDGAIWIRSDKVGTEMAVCYGSEPFVLLVVPPGFGGICRSCLREWPQNPRPRPSVP